VPALVTEMAFDLAQERLQENKRLSPRRTVQWSIVQSLVSCSKCGYGMCRSSTRTTARKIHYIKFYDPVVFPAPLARDSHCIQRRL
jgi:site-specific DNA recombinase